MNRDDTVYLRHILECIRRIAEDIAEGHERFMASHTLQDAVLRNLQVMSWLNQPSGCPKRRKRSSLTSNGGRLLRFETFWLMTIWESIWTRSGISPSGMCRN